MVHVSGIMFKLLLHAIL